MTVEAFPAPLRRVRRVARHIGRTLPPVLGLTKAALVRHPVWHAGDAHGGGTGVVVTPGFGGADASMAVLRQWLELRGYSPTGAGLGINVGCTEELVDRLEQRAAEHAERTGGPVLLVGHSRGGMLARMVAVRRPDLVRGLAMLGSPVLDPLDAGGLVPVVLPAIVRLSGFGVPGLLDGDCLAGPCGEAATEGLTAPLPVPAVAIYSRDDGVVGWRSCQDPEAEWVEVGSSHAGMGTDPAVYAALAARLAAWARSHPSS
ncbi:alpha/beta fold hydrolase [Pseudonocardia zijingensis]|uniref:AB hydrolase-1 domain-containing protein n=1 Tax=Pseudonocardia zijingensis TaxID=153376 RepID=A0ABP4A0I6_9PSEU